MSSNWQKMKQASLLIHHPPQRPLEDLFNSLGFGELQLHVDTDRPVFPTPTELEVTQMVRKPGTKPENRTEVVFF